jgi:hypothetical protein
MAASSTAAPGKFETFDGWIKLLIPVAGLDWNELRF